MVSMLLSRSSQVARSLYRSSFRRSTWALVSRTLIITCRGKPIDREDLYKFTNGQFLVNEKQACDRRYVRFDLDRFCAIAASAGGQRSPIQAIEKIEGGYSKTLLMRKEDGSEVVAKIPYPIAGPPKWTTASEVAVFRYLHMYTHVPVPKVLAWDADRSNAVGAEYIITTRVSGVPLNEVWDNMSDLERFDLVQELTKLEGDVARLRFPTYGSLYHRESIPNDDQYVALDSEADPSGEFCIGPNCERGWHNGNSTAAVVARFNRGPWPDIPSLGNALVDREIALLEEGWLVDNHKAPRGTTEEQIELLNMTKEVMSHLPSPTYLSELSEPVLWHTHLHMSNIYVSTDNPTKITSISDWQSTTIAPMFLQARFPKFLELDGDYPRGIENFPKLSDNYADLAAEDKEQVDREHQMAKLAKAYEISTGANNTPAYNALQIPPFLQHLFTKCGQVSENGDIPLRHALAHYVAHWEDLGFTKTCPISFSDEDILRHKQQWDRYCAYRRVQELATKLLNTDDEGWIDPKYDIATKWRENEVLLQQFKRRSNELRMSPEEVERIWPFREQ